MRRGTGCIGHLAAAPMVEEPRSPLRRVRSPWSGRETHGHGDCGHPGASVGLGRGSLVGPPSHDGAVFQATAMAWWTCPPSAPGCPGSERPVHPHPHPGRAGVAGTPAWSRLTIPRRRNLCGRLHRRARRSQARAVRLPPASTLHAAGRAPPLRRCAPSPLSLSLCFSLLLCSLRWERDEDD